MLVITFLRKIFILLVLLFFVSCGNYKLGEVQVTHSQLNQASNIDTLPIFDWKDYPKYKFELPKESIILDFNDFTMSIEGKFAFHDSISSDTIFLYEEVGEYLYVKLIQIKPNNKSNSFKLFLSAFEEISEQYYYEAVEGKGLHFWYNNRIIWTGFSDYEFVQDSMNYYRLPIINDYNGYFERKRVDLFNLRDTLVDHSSEADNIATIVYKEKPCNYIIRYSILKIEYALDSQIKKNKYLKILYSFGC